MKLKMFGIFGLVFIVIVCAIFLPAKEVQYDYLRLHIRANSNLEADQSVKYVIKDYMVDYLTPLLIDVNSKKDAEEVIENNKDFLIRNCSSILQSNGFYYSVDIKINNEYFPARTYENTTLDSGYYDAVIVELGEAEGDNWWCVMYPPLCFVNKNENVKQIKYKSILYEWFKKIFCN